MTPERKIWFVALGFFVVYGGLALFCYPVVSSDVVTRYVPMADEIARGAYDHVDTFAFGRRRFELYRRR